MIVKMDLQIGQYERLAAFLASSLNNVLYWTLGPGMIILTGYEVNANFRIARLMSTKAIYKGECGIFGVVLDVIENWLIEGEEGKLMARESTPSTVYCPPISRDGMKNKSVLQTLRDRANPPRFERSNTGFLIHTPQEFMDQLFAGTGGPFAHREPSATPPDR